MQIDFVPFNQVMEQEEIASRLANGWIIAGTLPIQTGSGIATPGNAAGAQIIPHTIWVLHEPMVPMSAILNVLFEAQSQNLEAASALLALDYVANRLMGTTLSDIREQYEKENPNTGEPEVASDNAAGIVVEAGDIIESFEAA